MFSTPIWAEREPFPAVVEKPANNLLTKSIHLKIFKFQGSHGHWNFLKPLGTQ
jgi:hypothetical protein